MGHLSNPIDELVTRLTYHCGASQILAGYKLQAVPSPTVDGDKDLPAIRIKVPTVSEAYRTAFVVPSISLTIILSTKRTTSPNAITEHMAAMEKLLDAIDTSESGSLDAGLGGTLRTPMTARTGAQYMLDLSVNTELTLNLEPRAAVRGSRRQ